MKTTVNDLEIKMNEKEALNIAWAVVRWLELYCMEGARSAERFRETYETQIEFVERIYTTLDRMDLVTSLNEKIKSITYK